MVNERQDTSRPVKPLDVIRRSRLLAIVRADRAEFAEEIVSVLIDARVEAIEVSLTTPDAIEIIRKFASGKSTSFVIGAGTVLTTAQTSAVVKAGAQFIVTPGLSESIETAVKLGIPSLVGVLTPSEAIEAVRRGASALKLFPAEVGGPSLLRALRAPLPNYEFIPVGGVSVDLVGDYLNAGAVALGVGSSLTGSGSSAPDEMRIRYLVTQYQEAIRAWDERPAL
jgi:2-dehydro-3-deoxyphosphogluconate aldolase / (4S)-4-hydroxy-2-oxoglutarate aldolase